MSKKHHKNYYKKETQKGDDVILETNTIIVYLACIFFIFILGKIFVFPIKKILKLLLNSILGAAIIYAINFIGVNFEFHIGLNLITAIFIGILGLPGAILLILLRLFLQ